MRYLISEFDMYILYFKAYMIANLKDLVHLKPGCDKSRNWRQSGNFARVTSAPGVFSDPTPEGVP